MRNVLIIVFAILSCTLFAQDVSIKVKAAPRTILVVSAHSDGCGVKAIKISRKSVERGNCCNSDLSVFHPSSTVPISRCPIYETIWKMSDMDFKRLEAKIATKCLHPKGDTTQIEIYTTDHGKTKHFVFTNCFYGTHLKDRQEAFVQSLTELGCD